MLGFKPCRCWTFGGCTNMAPMGTGGENSTELTCQDQLAKLGGCFVSRSFGTDEGENGVGPNRRSGTRCFDVVIGVGTIILKQICIWGRRNLLWEEEIWGLVCSLWWYCSYCGAFKVWSYWLDCVLQIDLLFTCTPFWNTLFEVLKSMQIPYGRGIKSQILGLLMTEALATPGSKRSNKIRVSFFSAKNC